MKTTVSFGIAPRILVFCSVALMLLQTGTACNFESDLNASTSVPSSGTVPPKDNEPLKDTSSGLVNASSIADAATILSRKQVPVLCYHHIKDWTPKTSARAKDYIVPVEAFKVQMKMLADSGYETILPDQLYNYLAANKPLPSKPVMITFDDTDLEQYTVALPELKKYGFKGVFFIMTVSLNRPNYMTRDQVKLLAAEGHEIGSHTWDHRNVKLYGENDWATQIDKPTKQLAEITGKPVKYFAYPFGLWNQPAIPELKKRGFVAAFQLSTTRDQQDPLYTIRRIIVPGYWGSKALNNSMVNSFR